MATPHEILIDFIEEITRPGEFDRDERIRIARSAKEKLHTDLRGPEALDALALGRIAHILRDPDWGVGMLEDIAELVAATGRDLSNPDGISTWDRH